MWCARLVSCVGACGVRARPVPVGGGEVPAERQRGFPGEVGLRGQVAQRGPRLQFLAQQEHLGEAPRAHHRPDEPGVLAT